MDIEIFAEIERVKTALENHSCTEALSWCADNKPALRKAKVRPFPLRPVPPSHFLTLPAVEHTRIRPPPPRIRRTSPRR